MPLTPQPLTFENSGQPIVFQLALAAITLTPMTPVFAFGGVTLSFSISPVLV